MPAAAAGRFRAGVHSGGHSGCHSVGPSGNRSGRIAAFLRQLGKLQFLLIAVPHPHPGLPLPGAEIGDPGNGSRRGDLERGHQRDQRRGKQHGDGSIGAEQAAQRPAQPPGQDSPAVHGGSRPVEVRHKNFEVRLHPLGIHPHHMPHGSGQQR